MATPHARNIVRKILHEGGSLRTQEIYKRGLELFPETPFPEPPPPKRFLGRKGVLKPAPPQPPNPRHPFRSQGYLKSVILPDLAASKEIEKFHSVVELSPEAQAQKQKRSTKSKAAIGSKGQDIWQWRFVDRDGGDKDLVLEEEPRILSPNWYQENTLWKRFASPEKTERKDPYGAGPLDHLNKRRRYARQNKIDLAEEWVKSVVAARREGARASSNEPL